MGATRAGLEPADGPAVTPLAAPVREPAAAPAGGGDANARASIGVALVAVFLAFLDVTIVNIAFPAIHRSFDDVALPHISWVLNGYNVVFAALLVPAGRVADMYGRRRLFLLGLTAFGASSALCASAPSADVLIAGRVVQAASAAVLVPASSGLMLAVVPRERHLQVIALWGAAASVAAAAGPALGGVIVHGVGWRWIFLVNVPLAALVVVVGRRLLRESRESELRARPDALGAALLTLGMGALTLGIVQGKDWGWGGARVVGAFAAAAVLLTAFVVRSSRHESPVFEPALLRDRRFGVSSAAMFILAVAFFAMLLCNVLFLTTVWRYSVLEAGLGIVPSPLFAALAAAATGSLASRYDPRWVIAVGGLVFAGGCLLLAERTGVHPDYVKDWLPAASATGVGTGIAFSVIAATGASSLPPGRYAVGTGILSAARQLGGALGVALAIVIIEGASRLHPTDAFHDTWRLAAGVVVVGTLVAVGIGEMPRRRVTA
jgi:EmrB/QacA subfamily drug resistance transporter